MSNLDSAVSLLTAEECVVTLAKVLDNILTEESYEKKTRKLKLSNETFSRRVARHTGGIDLLMACRFTKKGQTLQLKRENEDKVLLWNARRALQERAAYLGYTLPNMPPMPIHTADHLSGDNHERIENASLYETSTIGTITDDLDLQIFRELDNHSPSGSQPVTPVHFQTPVSPLGNSNLSTPDRCINKSLKNSSLEVPELPKPTNGATATPWRPPLAPRPVLKLPQQKAKRPSQQPVLSSEPEIVPEEDKLLKEMEEELSGVHQTDQLPVSSEAKDDLSPEENTLPQETYAESTGVHQQTNESLVKSEPEPEPVLDDLLLKEMEEELNGGASVQEPSQLLVSLEPSPGVSLEEDPLLREMEMELNGDGWADDDALLDDLDIEMSNDVVSGAPIEGDQLVVNAFERELNSVSVALEEAQRIAQSSKSPEPQPEITKEEITSLELPNVDVATQEDPLLNEMNAVLDNEPQPEATKEETTFLEVPNVDVATQEDPLLNEMGAVFDDEPQPEPEVAKEEITSLEVSKVDVATQEDTLLNERNAVLDNDVWAEEDSLVQEMEAALEEDPLLKEMEAELNDEGGDPMESEQVVAFEQEMNGVLASSNEPVPVAPRAAPVVELASVDRLPPLSKIELSEASVKDFQRSNPNMTSESKTPPELNAHIAALSAPIESKHFAVIDPAPITEQFTDLEGEMDALLGASDGAIAELTPPQVGMEMSDGFSPPSTIEVIQDSQYNFEQELPAPKKRSIEEEMDYVFGIAGLSKSSFVVDMTALEGGCQTPSSQKACVIKNSMDNAQIIGTVNPPPILRSQDTLNDCFNGVESAISMPLDYYDDIPLRSKMPKSRSGDDLHKEMASLLAQSSEVPESGRISESPASVLGSDTDSIHSERDHQKAYPTPDDDKSIPEQIQEARRLDLDNGSVEDPNYSSVHAHSDWLKLTELMKRNSLIAEYKACWGSLCTLSVVCADLPTEEFGLRPSNNGSKRKCRNNRSKRSWLPLELVQGLWNLVLSSEKSSDSTRIAYVCSKLHDVLIESQYLEILEREDNDARLPHNTWVRVRKEKMVLLGFALPISIAQQSEWMRKLAKAIAGDTQFWYGRYALPTIAMAGGDNEAMAKSLLRDMDFVQSRLDVVGVVTGTRRHVLDCRSYVQAKKKSFRDKQFKSEEFRVEIVDEAGHNVALDGCQQVAACLYKQGQVLTRSKAPSGQMIELAEALRLIGMAVGEWGDWEMEMQLYQKNMKVLHECGGYTSECAGDTLLRIGDCSLGQGNFGTAMGCYEEAIDIYRNQLGENSNKVAQALHHMGVIQCEKGELETAMETFKTSLKIKQDNGMKEDYDESTADTLCWIGKVYREQELPEKAKKYFDTARDVKEEYCGADSLEVAEILHNIAVLFDDSQDYERSLRYYRKSLKIRRAALGDQHDDVCDLIACIGNVYKSLGDDRTALKVFRRANELRASVAKTSVLNKQQTKILINSYEDLLDILRIQLKTSEIPEVEKDEIASILLKMGHLYDTIDIFSKSDRCFGKSLDLRLSSGDNVKAGQVLNVKGISFAKRQKYVEAMSAFEQALDLRKNSLGDGHLDVAETLHNMGNCAAKAGDLNEARSYYDEALRIKKKQLGSNNTSVAQTLHNIGNVLVGQGSNDGAMKSYQEALTLRRSVLGDDNVEVAYSLHCIAKINRKQHDIDAARDNFNAALRIKRLKLRKNHPSIAETLEQLGSLYIDVGEEEEGSLCLNGALNIYKSKHGEGVKVAKVYEQLGIKCERKQKIAKALVYFNKSLRVRVKVFGDDHESVADMHYRIGRLHRDQQSDHEALACFQAATKIRKKTIGRDDLVISNILTDAGILQMKLGQVDIADKCFGEALRIRNLILDPRHEQIGECLLLNGEVLVQNKKYEEAIELFKEALSIFQDNAGEYGLSCADGYQHLGQVYKITQEYDKAQDHYEKCLKARKDENGEENLDFAKVNHGLGEVYFARGDYRRAEEFFRDSVEVMVSLLGEDHLDVANAVLTLGRTCNKLNSPDEATMYFEQARLTKQHHLGDTHFEVIEIDLEIGRAHAVKKEYEEALQFFQSYLRARRAAVGDDVLVCDILHEIGTAEYDLGRCDAALKSLASALALYRVLLGDEQIQVADTLYSLGVVYETKRVFRESMKYHKEAFRLRRRLLGADDLSVAQSLDKISNLYMKQPNLEKALQSIKEVLRIRSQKLGKDHIDVGTSLFGMGVIFTESNELEKAMECYRVSLKIRTDHLGEASVEVAQTLHNLGTVFGKLQDFESALEHWRRALVAYREAGLSDEVYLVAVTIGNINMAEAYLEDSKDT